MSKEKNLENVKKLREITGVGFKDCKIALDETNGDIDKSVEYLRKKGIAKASKKMSRTAADGLVLIYDSNNKTSALEINSETDFVAKNKDFINFCKEVSEINHKNNGDLEKTKKAKMKNNKTVDESLINLISKIGEKITIGRARTLNSEGVKNYKYLHTIVKDNISKLAVIVSLKFKEESEKINLFGKHLSMHIAASNPISILQENIDKKILEKEQELISEELKNSGKPKEISDKISIGKLNKFKEENSLMTQNWVIDPKKKVKDVLNELNVPELKIVDFYRIKIGE